MGLSSEVFDQVVAKIGAGEAIPLDTRGHEGALITFGFKMGSDPDCDLPGLRTVKYPTDWTVDIFSTVEEGAFTIIDDSKAERGYIYFYRNPENDVSCYLDLTSRISLKRRLRCPRGKGRRVYYEVLDRGQLLGLTEECPITFNDTEGVGHRIRRHVEAVVTSILPGAFSPSEYWNSKDLHLKLAKSLGKLPFTVKVQHLFN